MSGVDTCQAPRWYDYITYVALGLMGQTLKLAICCVVCNAPARAPVKLGVGWKGLRPVPTQSHQRKWPPETLCPRSGRGDNSTRLWLICQAPPRNTCGCVIFVANRRNIFYYRLDVYAGAWYATQATLVLLY